MPWLDEVEEVWFKTTTATRNNNIERSDWLVYVRCCACHERGRRARSVETCPSLRCPEYRDWNWEGLVGGRLMKKLFFLLLFGKGLGTRGLQDWIQ